MRLRAWRFLLELKFRQRIAIAIEQRGPVGQDAVVIDEP
jgi:hypothetical protein